MEFPINTAKLHLENQASVISGTSAKPVTFALQPGALMLNSINHPDARGMKIFTDALMELFP